MHTIKSKIYTIKNNLGGQNIYCKKELMWTKYLLQKLASVNKTFTLKTSLGGQNIYCKTRYILQIIA